MVDTAIWFLYELKLSFSPAISAWNFKLIPNNSVTTFEFAYLSCILKAFRTLGERVEAALLHLSPDFIRIFRAFKKVASPLFLRNGRLDSFKLRRECQG